MRFRHIKRGTKYIVFDIVQYRGEKVLAETNEDTFGFYCSPDGKLLSAEVQDMIFQNDLVVLYYEECAELDKYWARPASQFFDGRFERI